MWYPSLLLMNRFNKTEAAVFTCFLRAFPFVSLLLFMLWSQIKQTPYYCSDLQITGKSDDGPGTGWFLRILSSVVTYRTGTGRRLFMITLINARPELLELNFTRIKQFVTCNYVYINVIIRHHFFKEIGG